ncbi:MAG: hypothetical protein OXE52_20385 [Chloroflexi bacterium]|nr:hypothetical protein [Chloroflexota bacterium]
MAGTTPRFDRTDGDPVADNGMNAEGENNAAMTAAAPTASYQTISDVDSYADDSVDIDSDNLNLTIATHGGDVLAHFQGTIHDGTNRGHTVGFNLEVDGVRQRGRTGIVSAGLDNDRQNVPIGFTNLIRNLSAGTHIFKFQWVSYQERVVRLKKDAQFWVREI